MSNKKISKYKHSHVQKSLIFIQRFKVGNGELDVLFHSSCVDQFAIPKIQVVSNLTV